MISGTHGTHGRTRAHGSLRRTSQPSKTPPTHPHDRTTARTGSKTPGGAGTHTGAYGRLLHSDVRDLTVSIERQMAEMGIKRLSVGDENGTIYLVLLVLNSSFDSKSNSLELSIPTFFRPNPLLTAEQDVNLKERLCVGGEGRSADAKCRIECRMHRGAPCKVHAWAIVGMRCSARSAQSPAL